MWYNSRQFMNASDRLSPLPQPTIRRYPAYLRLIRERMAAGEEEISSAALAATLGIDPVLARKDIAMMGIPGRPRWGYPARELVAAMQHALGWDNATDAALIGCGSLGHALVGYGGFAEQHLSIVVAFDANPELQGQTVHGVKVRPMTEIGRLVRRLRIRLGILTVPDAAAQECAEALVAAGVKGIWNFTSVQLSVPDDVIVQNVDLAQSLAVLSHAIANRERSHRS